jgi:uncharacterized protein (DUF1501 family)
MNRRDFIKAIMAATATSTLPLLSFSKNASAASPEFTDYKAIVILSLDGGNDAMNMFIPTESTAHDTYKANRSNLTIEKTNLFKDSFYNIDANRHFVASPPPVQPDPINEPNAEPIPNLEQPYHATAPSTPVDDEPKTDQEAKYRKGCYHAGTEGLGINSMMPEMASLYKAGKLSLISNVGTLVKPTTKAEIDEKKAELPVFLFAHNHQSRAVETTQADTLGITGWAGRIADAWEIINPPVGLNISFSKVNRMLIGATTWPVTMNTGIPRSYVNGAFTGEKIEDLLTRFADNTTHSNPFVNYYNKINKLTATLSTTLSTAWEKAPDFSSFSAKNAYGEDLFTIPETLTTLGLDENVSLVSSIFGQLESAAKMIRVSERDLKYNRQIFYVKASRYDSHSNQSEQHSVNLRSLSLALSDFYKALEEMGLDEQVLVVSTSEFGRTLLSNGDGTDHGWAGHSFMLTGDTSFNGGQTFGTVMTDLSLNGENSYTSRGRVIPTTSIEQMLAPALRWFGVEDGLMTTVLPNLNNFKTDSDANLETAFLQNVFVP